MLNAVGSCVRKPPRGLRCNHSCNHAYSSDQFEPSPIVESSGRTGLARTTPSQIKRGPLAARAWGQYAMRAGMGTNNAALCAFPSSPDVGHVVASSGKRGAARPHVLGIFSQRRIDARYVLEQAWVDLSNKPAQTSWVYAQIASSAGDVSTELPQRSANLFPVIIQPLEWGKPVISRRNERLDIIRTAVTEDLIE
jgi:hypothetical protein